MSTKDLALRIVKDQFGVLAEVNRKFRSLFLGDLQVCIKQRSS